MPGTWLMFSELTDPQLLVTDAYFRFNSLIKSHVSTQDITVHSLVGQSLAGEGGITQGPALTTIRGLPELKTDALTVQGSPSPLTGCVRAKAKTGL
jgi:hypothetical protein